jgi:hypothetical protein
VQVRFLEQLQEALLEPLQAVLETPRVEALQAVLVDLEGQAEQQAEHLLAQALEALLRVAQQAATLLLEAIKLRAGHSRELELMAV